MAARQKGSFSLGGTLEILADAPADARLCVKTKSELTDANSYPYKYVGMIVSVEDEGKAYILTAADTTVEANWREVGGGSAEFPSGGTTGQALVKKSDADSDVEWSTIMGIPNGGSTGQALVKQTNADKNVGWQSIQPIPTGGYKGQVLAKASADSRDVTWIDMAILNNGYKVTTRNKLNFTDFYVEDDYLNEETDIKAHRLTTSELNEICSELPPVPTRYFKYSTTEQIVGEWLDGKPIYQKTIIDTMPVITEQGKYASKAIPLGVRVDAIVSSNVQIVNTNGVVTKLNIVSGNTMDENRVGRYLLYTDIASDPNLLAIWCSNIGWSEKPVYATIQYTKVTD